MNPNEKQWVARTLDLPHEQLKFDEVSSSPLGKVVKIEALDRIYYFKSDKIIKCEVAKSVYIQERFGSGTFSIAGYCEEENWLLSENGGQEVYFNSDTKYLSDAISTLAQLHRLNLVDSDYEIFPVTTFNTNIFHDFIHTPKVLDYWGISRQERLKLIEITHYLSNVSYKLKIDTLSPSICHGDSHARNVLVSNEGSVRWFDWKEAHIGNPIGDVGFFLWWLTKDRKSLSSSLIIDQELIQALSIKYQKDSFGEVRFNSIVEIMMLGLAQRAILYHKTYYNLLDFKPFYVKYALQQLIKLHATKT